MSTEDPGKVVFVKGTYAYIKNDLDTWVLLGEAFSISGGSAAAADIQIMNWNDLVARTRRGKRNLGEFALECAIDLDDAGQVLVRSSQLASTKRDFRIVMNNVDDSELLWTAYITNFPLNGALNDVWKGTITMKLADEELQEIL